MDIIIPNSVTTIKEKAFESITCRKIQIPNSVTKIEKQAFNDCKIKSLVISIDSIEERTFKNANIGEITLCETIKNIEKYAFSKSTIGFIRIPKSMSIIKEGTFDNSEINFIGLPNSIERIEKFAFRNIYTQEIRNIIIEYIINVVCIIDSIIFFCTTKSFGFNYTDHIHKKYIDYFDYHSIRSFYHPLSLLRNKRFKDFIVHKTYLRTNNKKPEDIFNNNLSIYKKNSIIVIPPNCSYISPNAFDREDCYLTVFLPSKLINFKEDKEYKGNFIFYDEIDVSNDNDIYMPHTIKYIKISSYNNSCFYHKILH